MSQIGLKPKISIKSPGANELMRSDDIFSFNQISKLAGYHYDEWLIIASTLNFVGNLVVLGLRPYEAFHLDFPIFLW